MSRDYPDIIQTNSTDGAAATREFRVERKVDVLARSPASSAIKSSLSLASSGAVVGRGQHGELFLDAGDGPGAWDLRFVQILFLLS